MIQNLVLRLLHFHYLYCTLGARVRKIVCHPTEHNMVLSSVQGNNEISMWNLETGMREKVLWGSRTPPLSKTNVSCFKILQFIILSLSVCERLCVCVCLPKDFIESIRVL